MPKTCGYGAQVARITACQIPASCISETLSALSASRRRERNNTAEIRLRLCQLRVHRRYRTYMQTRARGGEIQLLTSRPNERKDVWPNVRSRHGYGRGITQDSLSVFFFRLHRSGRLSIYRCARIWRSDLERVNVILCERRKRPADIRMFKFASLAIDIDRRHRTNGCRPTVSKPVKCRTLSAQLVLRQRH